MAIIARITVLLDPLAHIHARILAITQCMQMHVITCACTHAAHFNTRVRTCTGASMHISGFTTTDHGLLDGGDYWLRRLDDDALNRHFQNRVSELTVSSDPRIVLLVSLLRLGFKWMGSGVVIFLRSGMHIHTLGALRYTLSLFRARSLAHTPSNSRACLHITMSLSRSQVCVRCSLS